MPRLIFADEAYGVRLPLFVLWGVAVNCEKPISLVILSHNRRDDLIANLTTQLDQADAGVEIIVVDNASDDGTIEALRALSERCPHLQVIFSPKNVGPAEGRNIGYERAKGEYIVSLDDDSSMRAEDLRRVPEVFPRHPEAGIIAFRVQHAPTGECQNDHGAVSVAVGNFHGAGYTLRRDLLPLAGCLDPKCRFGAEELDFSIRARAAGYSTIYEPGIVINHNNFRRQGPEGQLRAERWVYNFARINCKHFPLWMGLRNAVRYTRHYVFTYPGLGPWGAVRIGVSGIMGMAAGWRSHKQVPHDTVKFYSNPNLRPPFGNIPIDWRATLAGRAASKVWRRLRRVRKRF